ncbi:hypothetical protein GCM10023092_16830 [Rurimicrobium arvi]|uniref:T9SS type A sorting domain-containing protein n=1 Tax=Rurimicrobium arvi TaxID=2049916 RepID=A0ABP8MT83_9BACT
MYTHKKIKVFVTVFQEIVGPARNYGPADEYRIRNFIDKANYYLGNVPAPSDPLTIDGRNPHVEDSRFTLELVNINFTRAHEIYAAEAFSTGIPKSQFNDPNEVLNVFLLFSESESDSIPGGIAFNGTGPNDLQDGVTDNGAAYICLKNFYKNASVRESDENCAAFLLHEIGHLFGLNHTYCKGWGSVSAGKDCSVNPEPGNESDFDDLKDVFGVTGGAAGRIYPRPADCSTYPTSFPFFNPLKKATANDQYTNNFMGGNTLGHYMSPMQLGRMHRNAHFSAIRKYVYPLFPESRAHNREGQGQYFPHVITGKEVWDFDIKMYSDIIVKAGAQLTIKCKVAMPYMSNIIVEPGGELVLDGGTITSDRNDAGYFWYGISVWGRSKLPQIASAQGTVRVINGGTIANAIDGIIAGDGVFGSTARYGGIVVVDGGRFINNRRSIDLASYHYTYPFTTKKLPSACSVQRAQFIWDDDDHLDDYTFYHGSDYAIRLSEVDNVQLKHLSFNDNMSKAKRLKIGEGGTAIFSWQASYNIAHSTFSNTVIGMRAGGVRSEAISVDSCDFSYNRYSILVSGTVGVSVQHSRFNVYDLGLSSSAYQSGICMYGANAFDVGYNSFFRAAPDGTTSGSDAQGYGVRIEQCSPGNNLVHHNSFSKLDIHCLSRGRNTNGKKASDKEHTGLEFRCNQFDKIISSKHTADILVLGSNAATDGIRCVQGRSDQPVGNDFSDHIASTEMNLCLQESGKPVQVLPISKYYYSSSDPGRQAPSYYSSGVVTLVPVALSSGCMLPALTPEVTATIGAAGSSTTFKALCGAMNDTTASRLNLVEDAYRNMKSPYATAELSFFYLGEGRVEDATRAYASIFTSQEWNIDSAELSEFKMGAVLLRIMAAHVIDSIPVNVLSEKETDSLNYLTANAQTWPRAKACAWLHFATGAECSRFEPAYAGNDNSGNDTTILHVSEMNDMGDFSVRPNPVNELLTVSHTLRQTALLRIYDAFGRTLSAVVINPSESKLTVQTAAWTPGLYFYQLIQDGKVTRVGKIAKQ